MNKLLLLCFICFFTNTTHPQDLLKQAEELKGKGLLMPALEKYGQAFSVDPSDKEISYKIATTTALLWTSQMRDTSFFFLKYSLENDFTLGALSDPHFLSLIDDPRWEQIVDSQIEKYESKNGKIENEIFARALFRMIITDQGFMYAGNIERRKYIQSGGYFTTPAIFPLLAMEEKYKEKNISDLLVLLDAYQWPTASQVTETAAGGAALIINHSSYELRSKYFPMLKAAFEKGEA